MPVPSRARSVLTRSVLTRSVLAVAVALGVLIGGGATSLPAQAGSAATALGAFEVAHASSSTPAATARRTAEQGSVSAGGQFSCGIQSGGALSCWGFDSYGQLGNGRTGAGSATPTPVGSSTGWAQVSAGGATACAVRVTHALFCWGLDHRGQLGDGDHHSIFTPHHVKGRSMWQQVSTGWWHTCGVRTNHTLWCWGDDSSGQLGIGSTKSDLAKHKVPGATWASVSVQGWNTCATKTDGTLWCWGRNLFGEIGNGTLRDEHQPAQVGSAHNWQQVALSWTHACAMTRAGEVRCWGRNDQHQVGPSTSPVITRPTTVPGGHVARSIAVAEGSSCLVDTTGGLWCWGDNRYGQVSSTLPSVPGVSTPVRRAGTYRAVDGGWFHFCAQTTSGTPSCWGEDEKGQLGASGPTAAPPSPTPAAPRRKAGPLDVRIAAFNTLGNHHTLPGRDADNFPPSRLRADWEAQIIANNDLQVASIEEQDAGQLSAILTAAHGTLASFPTPSAGDLGVETTIVWNAADYHLVKSTLVKLPFVARSIKRPAVELQQVSTGRTFWVFGVHNAPNTQQAKRDAEAKIEIAEINKLTQTGMPVFFLGDMNEKDTLYCKIVRQTSLSAASGGSLTPKGRCVPPKHQRIDWIFGPKPTSTWSGFTYLRPPLVRLSTDHHIAVVDAQVP